MIFFVLLTKFIVTPGIYHQSDFHQYFYFFLLIIDIRINDTAKRFNENKFAQD